MGLLHRWWREGNRKHILGRGRDVSSKTLAIAMAKTGEYEHYVTMKSMVLMSAQA